MIGVLEVVGSSLLTIIW